MCRRPSRDRACRGVGSLLYFLHDDGAEYIAVCLPAFSMEAVDRDQS